MSDILILENEKNDVIDFSQSFGEEKSFLDKINDKLIGAQKIKTSEKVVIYRLLSTMVDAGISLLKAVAILEKQDKNPVVKNILSKFQEELKSGKSLSMCMSMF
ncbi:MAG: type II secretion system F family protein, partial [Candidatus Gracilibacteria bacterium]|nr:type II secretion system F family protein [Candidatus Gracilibacteria bacterium]